MTPDTELLHRFDRTNSEDAFGELVQRHVNLVYAAALRQVNGDAHLAKDVAQSVFTDLARKAGSLARRESLTGWLYTSAHHAAAKIVRTETRRRDREETFMRDPMNEPASADEWENLRPSLDAAMHELKATDREVILLRYFENRPFAEVGAKLGLNENAARMRVERALEKLRAVFAKRGIAATSALAAVISANAVQLAPAGLAATLTTASIVSAGAGTFTLLKIMTATKLKLGISALVVATATTALVVQHQAQDKLREENGVLQQQIAQLQADNESYSNRLVSAGDAKKLPDDQFNELLKLRGEVTLLRNNAHAFMQPGNASARQEADQADSAFLIQGRTVADWVSEFQIGGFPGETNLANGVLDSAGPPILPQLARLLRDKSFDQKAKAAAAINEICYLNPDTPEADAVIPTLTASTKNDDSEVRIYSVQALGAIGKAASSATLDLIQLTRDPNASVRMCAVETLGRIGADSPESIAALKAALSDTSADVGITAKKTLELIQSNHQ